MVYNIMPLRNWYLIQTAAVDPAARTKKFDDKLMGELIRFVSSRSRHTLGLRHNMELVLQQLRDKEYQEKRTYFFYHGLCTFQLCCAARRWGDCFIP
jgi:hypothetical protein